jgi:hypothetical protein
MGIFFTSSFLSLVLTWATVKKEALIYFGLNCYSVVRFHLFPLSWSDLGLLGHPLILLLLGIFLRETCTFCFFLVLLLTSKYVHAL